MIKRLPDWRARLDAYVAAASEKQFSFGSHDCGGFAMGAVAAWSGRDAAAISGFTWKNEHDVDTIVSTNGTLHAASKAGAAHIGLVQKQFEDAVDGDVAYCVVAAPGVMPRYLLGIVWRGLGAGAIAAGRRGLIRLRTSSVIDCWGAA